MCNTLWDCWSTLPLLTPSRATALKSRETWGPAANEIHGWKLWDAVGRGPWVWICEGPVRTWTCAMPTSKYRRETQLQIRIHTKRHQWIKSVNSITEDIQNHYPEGKTQTGHVFWYALTLSSDGKLCDRMHVVHAQYFSLSLSLPPYICIPCVYTYFFSDPPVPTCTRFCLYWNNFSALLRILIHPVIGQAKWGHQMCMYIRCNDL